MKEQVFISMPIDQFRVMLTDTVNACLKEGAREFDKHMTAEELAEYIDVALSTVHKWSSKGIVPGFKKGKRLYFSKKEIDQWLRQQKKKTLAEIESEAATHVALT